MKARSAAVTVLLALVAAAPAALADTFEIRAKTSRASFTSEAPLETIVGTTAMVSGRIEVDPARPQSGARATVEVDLPSIRTGVDLRDEHFRSPMWLHTDRHPKATFELTRLDADEGARLEYDKKVRGTVHGKLTIKGVTKDVSAPVTVGLFRTNEKLAKLGLTGDILRVKTELEITLADYGVQAPENLAGLKVADTVRINLDLTAIKK